MNWAEFKEAAPELAAVGKERFDRTGIVLLGSTRKDGTARISPVEHFIFEGELYLGMMWRSLKALDLRRDPRCAVNSAVIDKNDTAGEFKLRGRAVEVSEPETVDRYCRAVKEATGWCPEGPFHLFRIDVDSAVFIKH